jgi:small neutral amino acid transporter SnatA (MarC family)
MKDRSKATRLALIFPWLIFGAFMLSLRLNGRWLELLVGIFAVAIGCMLVYVAIQMVKARRRTR